MRTPTLFLWGADDGFGGEDDARRLAALIPDAELSMMPAAGHLPWLDDPESATRVVDGFISGRSGHVRRGSAPLEPAA